MDEHMCGFCESREDVNASVSLSVPEGTSGARFLYDKRYWYVELTMCWECAQNLGKVLDERFAFYKLVGVNYL